MSKEQIKDNFETALRDCLETAAVSTAVLVIVTGGMGLSAAVQAFVAAVMNCLEQKVTAAVACLISGLKIVQQSSDWEEKAW
jgi:hypothetical protein